MTGTPGEPWAGSGRVRRSVGWFQIVVGVAVAALWTALLVTGSVPEVDQGRVDIWFHIAAELAMAALMVAGGVAVLRGARRGPLLSALVLGMLAYSAVNSTGYYAESGDWVLVAAFAVLLTITGLAVGANMTTDERR